MKPEGSLPCSQLVPIWAKWFISTSSRCTSSRCTLILLCYLLLGFETCLFPSGFQSDTYVRVYCQSLACSFHRCYLKYALTLPEMWPEVRPDPSVPVHPPLQYACLAWRCSCKQLRCAVQAADVSASFSKTVPVTELSLSSASTDRPSACCSSELTSKSLLDIWQDSLSGGGSSEWRNM